MRLLASFKVVRVALAFAVSLWMAGAGCLLGCEKSVAAAATEVDQQAKSSVLVAQGDVCAAHGTKRSSNSNHRGKSSNSKSSSTPTTGKPQDNAQTLASGSGSSSMMNCPLAVNASAALSKSGPDTIDDGFAIAKVNQPPAQSLEQTTALARQPRLPNRGHTYLHCCAFLI
jgi:hypothetical protein